jgi:hypothetical protein
LFVVLHELSLAAAVFPLKTNDEQEMGHPPRFILPPDPKRQDFRPGSDILHHHYIFTPI